ncbi:MAG TPA: Maf family protein [Candidatus Cybelea sp.]|nr:Maf family protein [Candidatus Cybelea sp.]
MTATSTQALPAALRANAPVAVLASTSPTRRRLLEQAGVACSVEPPGIDEAAIKQALLNAETAADDAALALAEAKALAVSRRRPGWRVIGADQLLACEGRWFDKPAGRDGAKAQLRALRGRTHVLHSAVCAARDGTIAWRHVERAHMTMRDCSDRYLDDYLNAAGAAVCQSVGAYQLEGLGAQLFERVEGDYFAILGLPLLPLLAYLRRDGALPA